MSYIYSNPNPGNKIVGDCVIRGISLNPFNDGGAQEAGMRAGTENVASIVGMAKALQKNCAHIKETKEKLNILERELIYGLKENNIDFIRNGKFAHGLFFVGAFNNLADPEEHYRP